MSSVAKSERLEARVSSETKELLTRAAALQGQTLTDFVVSTASESARRVIRETELIELSTRDQIKLAEALLNPPPPNEKLIRAAAAYKARLEE